MGILDDYLDVDNIDDEENVLGFDKPKDGTYEFEIGDAHWQKWTKKDIEHNSFVIDYYLTDADGNDAPKASDFLTMPDADKDPEDYTMQEKISIRTLRDRFYVLGFEKEQFSKIERDDLVGLTGMLTLKTNAKGWQNIVAFSSDEEAVEAPEPAPKAARSTRQAGKVSPKAKAEEPAEEEEPTFSERPRRTRRSA
jgi:hypothetical protein